MPTNDGRLSRDRIARVQALIQRARPNERAEMVAAALQAITAEEAVEVVADWAEAAEQIYALNAALLARLAAIGPT